MVHIPLLWQKRALSGSLERLVEAVVSGRDKLAAGAIVPVPLYRQRRRERGSLEERWDSVRGAFATRPSSQVDNLRFLLVDGVYDRSNLGCLCASFRGSRRKVSSWAYRGPRIKKSTAKLPRMVE